MKTVSPTSEHAKKVLRNVRSRLLFRYIALTRSIRIASERNMNKPKRELAEDSLHSLPTQAWMIAQA